MNGVEVHDRDPRGVLAVGLHELLEVLGPATDGLMWSCSNVECIGPSAVALHAVSDDGTTIDGARLRELAADLVQVVDGELVGKTEGGDTAVVLRAIDSALWEVFADERSLGRVSEAYSEVRRASSGAV